MRSLISFESFQNSSLHSPNAEKGVRHVSQSAAFEPPFTSEVLPPGFDSSQLGWLDGYSSFARYNSILPKTEKTVAHQAFQQAKGAIDALDAHVLQKNGDI